MNTVNIKLYDLFRTELNLPDAKALKFVQAVEEATNPEINQIATKHDIAEVKLETERTKSDLLKWFIGLFIIVVLMILGLYAAILLKR